MFSWEFSQYTTIQISRGVVGKWVGVLCWHPEVYITSGYIQPQKVFWSLLDILDQAVPVDMQREPGRQAILPNVFLITLIFPCSYELHLVQDQGHTLCTGNIKKTEHSGSLKLKIFFCRTEVLLKKKCRSMLEWGCLL